MNVIKFNSRLALFMQNFLLCRIIVFYIFCEIDIQKLVPFHFCPDLTELLMG